MTPKCAKRDGVFDGKRANFLMGGADEGKDKGKATGYGPECYLGQVRRGIKIMRKVVLGRLSEQHE